MCITMIFIIVLGFILQYVTLIKTCRKHTVYTVLIHFKRIILNLMYYMITCSINISYTILLEIIYCKVYGVLEYLQNFPLRQLAKIL